MFERLKHKRGVAGGFVRLCGYVFESVEKLKGPSTFKELSYAPCLAAKMTATSIGGYDLSVYCRVRHYARVYQRQLAPTKHIILYQVYSVASADAPKSLREACETTIVIPAWMHWCVNNDVQEALAVRAYLDILIDRLEPKCSVRVRP